MQTLFPDNLLKVVPTDANSQHDPNIDDTVKDLDQFHSSCEEDSNIRLNEEQHIDEEDMDVDDPETINITADAELTSSGYANVIKVVHDSKKNEKYKKEAVMPTWSATQHLLCKHRNSEVPVKTNSEVVSLLYSEDPLKIGLRS